MPLGHRLHCFRKNLGSERGFYVICSNCAVPGAPDGLLPSVLGAHDDSAVIPGLNAAAANSGPAARTSVAAMAPQFAIVAVAAFVAVLALAAAADCPAIRHFEIAGLRFQKLLGRDKFELGPQKTGSMEFLPCDSRNETTNSPRFSIK
jgi:hypothetical protein